jgi:hypothetical protein
LQKNSKAQTGECDDFDTSGCVLRGQGGDFLDRINRIYRIGGFFDRMTGFAGGTGWGGGRCRSFSLTEAQRHGEFA